MGGLAELFLVVGPVMAFAIYELVKLERDKSRAAAKAPATGAHEIKPPKKPG